MAYDVIATLRFKRKYRSIIGLFKSLGFSSSAAELELRIAELSGTLATFPEMFPVHKETHYGSNINYRYVMMKNYIVFYKVNEKKKIVTIMDIVHAKNIK